LQAVPIKDARNETIPVGVDNRVAPYVQNFNFELQRELARDLSLSIAYVGTKGTRLWSGVPQNSVNVEAAFRGETFVQAFNTTRAGGSSPMFDAMLNGLNLGSGAVNGTTVTGSASLRANTNTRSFIANGNVAGLADFLNRSTNVTGRGGGLLDNSGLFPQNFFVLNPQFQFVTLHGNALNSTYHSMQVQVTKRLSQGFTNQTTYTWSRALGASDDDATKDFRDHRNRSLDKSVLGYHRTHSFQTNGTYTLPFGAGQRFLADAPSVIQRIVERWQFGGIFSWTSGAPINVLAPVSTVNQVTTFNTPDIVGEFPKSTGEVTKLSNGVTYFPGFRQVDDPARGGVTTANALQGQFSNKAITDENGNLLLVNPTPGRIGNMGLRWLEGPRVLGFDMNLIKQIRIAETRDFELRVDVVNVLNTPQFAVPTAANMSINSNGFGRISTATGARRFTIGARLNF
jgi:hypothetical protein